MGIAGTRRKPSRGTRLTPTCCWSRVGPSYAARIIFLRTHVRRLERGHTVGKGNDNDRYVVKRSDGWAVVKEDHERASAVTPTQREAIGRAKEITHNLGGGEVRIQNRHGKFREGDRER
jgi:hypothetical protein